MKKVLFVTYDFPYPTNSGGKTRAYNMLKHSGNDVEKFLISFIRPDFNNEYIKEMEKIDVKVLELIPRKKVMSPTNALGLIGGKSIFNTLYFSKGILAQIIQQIIANHIDVVHFESFYTSFFIGDEIKKTGAKQIFGTENIESNLYEDYASNNTKKYLRRFYMGQVGRIRREEEEIFKKADFNIAVSDDDAEVIKKYSPKVGVVRNGVDFDEFKFHLPKKEMGSKLLFVGNFSYFPNVDAMNFFYKEVFKDLPDNITLTAVGRGADNLSIKDSRITFKEYVPKIQDEYEKADLMIAPIRLGGGTNFKIIEAMAVGLPVICLPHRIKGIGAENEKHLVVAETAWDFVGKTKVLLEDLKKRQRIAKAAREFAEKEYSWDVIGKRLNKYWKEI
ncbi:MAG TPA: glycosyltransferase family 4 protein [Patescibacteria group bacterium]|nr:glycosyltransferase family 4 protein [Patescibacteria group bacterium]